MDILTPLMMMFEKIKEGPKGFWMDEVMTGDHEFEPGCGPKGKHFFEFRGTWGTNNFKEWLDSSSDKFMINDLKGKVTVGGLCKDIPLKGRLELKYFSENKIIYIFDFKYKNKTYHYIGEKVNIHLWNLPVAHTTCFGVLTNKKTGKLISRSLTHFRILSAPSFLASLRLA